MHRDSSTDQQAGSSAGANSEREERPHNEALLSQILNERSSSDIDGGSFVLEGEPRYIRRTPPTDEERRWQLLRALLVPFELVGEVIRIIMNAAVTIFGMGVGVGLILGDSFRPSSVDRAAAGENTSVGGSSGVTSQELSSSLGERGVTTGRAGSVAEPEVSSLSRPSLSDLPPQ